jgi:hypothetical protein
MRSFEQERPGMSICILVPHYKQPARNTSLIAAGQSFTHVEAGATVARGIIPAVNVLLPLNQMPMQFFRRSSP